MRKLINQSEEPSAVIEGEGDGRSDSSTQPSVRPGELSLHSLFTFFSSVVPQASLFGFTHYTHLSVPAWHLSRRFPLCSPRFASYNLSCVSSGLSVSSLIFQEVFSVDMHMLKMPFSQQRILH